MRAPTSHRIRLAVEAALMDRQLEGVAGAAVKRLCLLV